jgi:hypothetical protein
VELDAEHAGETGERVEGRVVSTGFEARDCGLLHPESPGQRGLGQGVLDAEFDEARCDRSRDHSSIPFCPNVRILQLTRNYLVARSHPQR